MISWTTVLCVATSAILATSVIASEQALYGKPPLWVTSIPIPDTAPAGGAVQILLEDSQTRFDAAGVETFVEVATKALTPQGVSGIGNIVLPWNPETQTLTINQVRILRDGKVRDLLAGGKTFTVIRRESSLELSMIDGTLTATFQPDDVRVGDVLDFAATIRWRDPVMKGHGQNEQALVPAGQVGRLYLRDVWPEARPIRWRATKGLPTPKLIEVDGGSELIVDAADATPLKPPAGAPDRFNHLGQLELSDFANWAEASALMAPLYDKAAILSPDSPLRLELRKIREVSRDPKARALAALQLVQEQTRYLYLGMNFGNYTPTAADVTWTRRFADCKGKTALLLALLRDLEIDAEPAMVSTSNGDGLDQRLPSLGYFDHVLIRAHINGKTYWLDGTRPHDRDLESIAIPNFHWALPIQTSGATLERLSPPPFDEPQFERRIRYDVRSGPDTPAPAHVEFIYRDDFAISERLKWQAVAATDLDRQLRQFWTDQYAWITADKVSFTGGKASGTTVLTLDGTAKIPWTGTGASRQYRIDESGLGEDSSLHREPGPDLDAPYAVTFPNFSKSVVTLQLPNNGKGYSVGGARDIDETIGARVYSRRSTLIDGLVTMIASHRSLAPEFPATEAALTESALRDLASADVVVRTDSFYVSTGRKPDLKAEAEPKDAAGYTARGAYRLSTNKTADAIADFDAAIRLDHNSAKRFFNRGVARFEAKDDKGAIADFDETLRRAPRDARALLARGEVRLLDGKDELAEADLKQAVTLAPSSSEILRRRAEIYDRAGKLGLAIQGYDLWLQKFPGDEEAQSVLGSRCWALARRGRALEVAAKQCDAAVAASPNNNRALEGRGVIALRLNNPDRAIEAFTAANTPVALYGRGLAESRKGLGDAAAHDYNRALVLKPDVRAVYAKMGISTEARR